MEQIHIKFLNNHGLGYARTPTGTVIVPGALPGEHLLIQRFQREYRRDIGKIISHIQPSSDRQELSCSRFPDCPGCQFCHISPEIQHKFAIEKLDRCFHSEFEKLNIKLEPIMIPAGQHEHYRQRTTLRPAKLNGEFIVGMPSIFPGEQPVDLSGCKNHTDILNRTIRLVVHVLKNVFSSELLLERICDISFHVPDVSEKRVVITTVNIDDYEPHFREKLCLGFKDKGISVFHHDVKSEKVSREFKKPDLICGKQWLQLVLSGRSFSVLPSVWTPVSMYSEEQLIEHLRKLKLDSGKELLEVGCGAGLISLTLSYNYRKIYGIDMNRWAIQSAEQNRIEFGIKNCEFRVGKGKQTIKKMLRNGYRADTVFVHGMRRPYGSQFVDLLKVLSCENIVLISPSMASCLKDMKLVFREGFSLENIALIHQLAETSGFLTVCHLRKDRRSR